MLPYFTGPNHAYERSRDTESSCDGWLGKARLTQSQYLPCLFFCDLTPSLRLRDAWIMVGPMAVFLMRHVSKVAQAIVELIAILMIRFFPFRGWTDKCQKNKNMDCGLTLLPVLPQVHAMILVTFRAFEDGLYQVRQRKIGRTCFMRSDSSNSSLVADLVQSFVAGNVFPGFGGKIGVGHGGSSIESLCQEPQLARTRFCGSFYFSTT